MSVKVLQRSNLSSRRQAALGIVPNLSNGKAASGNLDNEPRKMLKRLLLPLLSPLIRTSDLNTRTVDTGMSPVS